MSRFALLLVCALVLAASAAAQCGDANPDQRQKTKDAVKASTDAVMEAVNSVADSVRDAKPDKLKQPTDADKEAIATAVNDATAAVTTAVTGVSDAVQAAMKEKDGAGGEEKIAATLALYKGGKFSTLVAAVTAAGLVEAVDAEGPFTVFAPTDKAFKAYLKEADTTAAELLGSPDLGEILQHHIVQGKYTAADVLAMDLPTEIATLGGAMINLDKTTDGTLLVAGREVELPDIEAKNGIIHGINGVITDVAASQPNLELNPKP